eukprot:127192_1
MMKASTLTRHVSSIDKDNTFTKAVFGFYHIHSHNYITSDIIQLSIQYLLTSDAFISDDTDTQNALVKGGIDSNICQCVSNGIECSVFGRNTISQSKVKRYNHHHWRFKVFHENTQSHSATNDDGGVARQTVPTFSLRIGIVGLPTYVDFDQETCQNNSIIDMYLDLNNFQLCFRHNNIRICPFNDCKVALANITTKTHKMMIQLSGKQTIELVSYHHSKRYDWKKNRDIHTNVGYMHSVSSVGKKKRLINFAFAKYPEINDELQNELQNAFIDCLLVEGQFGDAYNYITDPPMTRIPVTVQNKHNIAAIGNYFYDNTNYYHDHFPEALAMFLLIDDEDLVIAHDLFDIWFKMAKCYDKLNTTKKRNDISPDLIEYRTAIKYYNLFLKHQKDINSENAVHCLVRMGAMYMRDLKEHGKALECYLKLDELTLENPDLEFSREIAVCYEMEKDHKNALLWYTKAKNTHTYNQYLNEECCDKILDLSFIIYGYEKVEEDYNNAVNTDEGRHDVSLHCRFAGFLLRRTEQYQKTMMIYKKVLEMYPITYGQKEKCYIGLGMVCYKLGDFDKAIEHTKRAFFFNDKCATALNNLGYFYLMAKQYELSHEYLIKCIAVSPKHDSTNGYLGNCLYEMEKYDEAIVYLKKSIAKETDLNDPNVGPICLENYANILNMNYEHAESLMICMQLMTREEFSKHKNKDKIYYLISANCVHLRCLEMALEYGLQAISIKHNEQKYVDHVNDIKHMIEKR